MSEVICHVLNAGEESLLNVCGGFKTAPPYLPGLCAIRIAPGGYRGRVEQSTGQQEGREDFFALDFPRGESMPSTESGVSGGGRAHGSATAATQGPSAQSGWPFLFAGR